MRKGHCEGHRQYLLGLLEQLHSLPQDLAVELPALTQELSAHLLYSGLQVLALAGTQSLAGSSPWLLLQRIVQGGLQVLDFLQGPNHRQLRLQKGRQSSRYQESSAAGVHARKGVSACRGQGSSK